MSRKRFPIWLTLIVLAIGGAITAIVGLFTYIAVTTTPLHPDANGVPSVTRSAPPQKWSAAVEQARQIAREDLAGQNLPGLSLAVGAGGDLVWAEGFGWADIDQHAPVSPDTR